MPIQIGRNATIKEVKRKLSIKHLNGTPVARIELFFNLNICRNHHFLTNHGIDDQMFMNLQILPDLTLDLELTK